MNPILKTILETKRPTNNPQQNLAVTTTLLKELRVSYVVDEHNNVAVDLGGVTCFTAHTDTVDNKLGTNLLAIKNNNVSVVGGGVLGADCGSGMYVMIRMIQVQVPGLYVFFATEEQGRIGSSAYTMPTHIKHCVSFDRKGTDNLITHQMSERGCSDAFADAFTHRLPHISSSATRLASVVNIPFALINSHTLSQKSSTCVFVGLIFLASSLAYSQFSSSSA